VKQIEVIERQLDRVLTFFPRVEARINGLFAFNSIILTLVALNFSASDLRLWYLMIPAIVTGVGLSFSYYFLFKANFPQIKAGEGNLVYFGEIKKRSEADYRDAFLACSDDRYRNDLIGQIWRNSQILCAKYEGIRFAIMATAFSVVPFLWFLIATAVTHGRIPLLQAG
jgi:hypothetical protein